MTKSTTRSDGNTYLRQVNQDEVGQKILCQRHSEVQLRRDVKVQDGHKGQVRGRRRTEAKVVTLAQRVRAQGVCCEAKQRPREKANGTTR